LFQWSALRHTSSPAAAEQPGCSADVLFPRLLAGMEHPALAVQVLDLANYVTRQGMAAAHPAAGRLTQLLQLYSGLVNHLQNLEQRPQEFVPVAGKGAAAASQPAEAAEQLRRMVSGSVELLVSLSDALALIGDDRAVGKLRQALSLSHRRVRAEAAAALARLGDAEGVKTLVRLAAEPSVRRRAIAYLQELGKLEEAPEDYRTEVALAQGDFAAWLAEPTQLGMPPHAIALFDSRRLRWPGYDEPVDCYLFQYEYHFARGRLRGVGIAGPVMHALATDLTDLPPEDIYAIYAGWHAEHEEAGEVEAGALSPEQSQLAEAAQRDLEEIGYEDVQVLKLGKFFGDTVAVAAARLAGESGIVVTAGDRAQWFPNKPAQPKLGGDEIYCLFKGRALLSAFNSSADSSSADSADDARGRRSSPRPR
jgi:hypothetical protein